MALMLDLPSLLDTRSFSSLWYWLALAGVWAWAGRGALGIPTDVVRRARREPGAAALLLDWISLVAPRWRVGEGEGALIVAIAAFGLTALAVLGVAQDRAFAQALLLLGGPLVLLGGLRVRLARRLGNDLAAVGAGRLTPAAAGALAARRICRHMIATRALSVGVFALAGLAGARWLVRHRLGF